MCTCKPTEPHETWYSERCQERQTGTCTPAGTRNSAKCSHCLSLSLSRSLLRSLSRVRWRSARSKAYILRPDSPLSRGGGIREIRETAGKLTVFAQTHEDCFRPATSVHVGARSQSSPAMVGRSLACEGQQDGHLRRCARPCCNLTRRISLLCHCNVCQESLPTCVER